MSLAVLADHLASRGRGEDTMLVHMTPGEVKGLQALALAHGGSLTINPETGLVEAGWLKRLLPAIAGFALNAIAPGVGTAIGGMLGLGGAAGTAIAVGGITGLATGSLKQGIMAGLGAYGGASLASGVLGASGAQGAAGALGVQGAATGAGSQAAMLAEQTAGFGAEGLQKLAEGAAYAKGAAPSLTPALSAGFSNLGTEAGRKAFMDSVGGAKGLMRAGMAVAAPVVADAMVPTATQMPAGGGFQYPARIRPMSWNQYTGALEQLPMFSAVNRAGITQAAPAPAPAPAQPEQPPEGYRGGGIVALAAGGAPNVKEFMDKTGADFQTASDLIYGVRGSNPETRNWDAIMAAQDPIAAARQATANMYGGVAPRQMMDPVTKREYSQLFGGSGVNLTGAGSSRDINFGVGLTPTQEYLLGQQASTPAASNIMTPEQFKQHIYQGGADDVLATKRGVEYARSANLTPQQTLDVWNQALGTNFGMADYERVMKQFPGTSTTPGSLYLQANPDVAAAYANRLNDPNLASTVGMTPEQFARTHYEKHGKGEQREWPGSPFAGPTVPGYTGTDTTYGGDTTFSDYEAPQPEVTLGDPFKPKAPTMSEVINQYEQGGGATRMPTITDIKPGERTYTLNAVADLITGYLQANPNALYSDVVAFANSRGIPEMQARAAYNEFRFSGMTGGTKSAYDYLMGRGAYPVNQVLPGNAPIMRPYAEAAGLAPAGSTTGGGGFFGRKTIPTEPERRTAQGVTEGSGGVSGVGGGTGGGTMGGGISTLPSSFASTTGTAINTETGQTYTPVKSDTPITDALFGTQDSTKVPVVDRSTYSDAAAAERIQDVLRDDALAREVENVTAEEQLMRDIARGIEEQNLEAAIARERELQRAQETAYYDYGIGQPDAYDYSDYGAGYEPYNAYFDYGGSPGIGGRYTMEEQAALAGLRKGGIATLAAGAAGGGQFNLGGYSDGGRLLRGPGDGVSDSIPATIGNKQPARLADGEFVIPARIVSEIGNGSTEAGARKLYKMMERVQRARAKTVGKGRSKVAKDTRADKYLPA